MDFLHDYELDYVEGLGYLGGFILAVALIPQVVHSYKTQSTADLSYSWQITYILGLWLNFVYFWLVDAVAAWATLLFEMAFAHYLLALKFKIDGCRADGQKPSDNNGNRGDDHIKEEPVMAPKRGISKTISCGSRIGNFTEKLTVGDAFRFHKRSSVTNLDLVSSKYRGFHYMIDVRFEKASELDPKSLGEDVVQEMLQATTRHGIRSVGDMLRVFDGSDSPPGFASVILLDESHMTAHCYSEEGMLAFDCFTCGSHPEGTRLITKDMVTYFQQRFGNTAKIETFHMPRFPVEEGQGEEDTASSTNHDDDGDKKEKNDVESGGTIEGTERTAETATEYDE